MKPVFPALLCLLFPVLISNCRTLNTAQKFNSLCFDYRGVVVSPDKNKFYKNGDDCYVELEVQDCEMSVAWVKDFSYVTDLGYNYKVKEDSDGKKERKYVHVNAAEMEKCSYPYLLPDSREDFLRLRPRMDRELLLDQDCLEENEASLSEWPDAWKKIPAKDKETLYIVDREEAWYWTAFLPFTITLYLGVDLPSGLVFVLWDGIFDKDEDSKGTVLTKEEESE